MFQPAVWFQLLLILSLSTLQIATQTALGQPIDVDLVYTGEFWTNQRGGIKTGEVYLDNLDLILEADGEQLIGWTDTTLYGHLLYNNSNTLSNTLIGDSQVVSNIDNSTILSVMELWIETSFGSRSSVKFGLYDLNSEFDAIETAGLFINASHGIGPDYSQSGENGPSIFPVSSLAIRWAQDLTESLGLRLAVLDAVPGDLNNDNYNYIKLRQDEGVLVSGELNFASSHYRVGAGRWYYSDRTSELLHDQTDHNQGIYGFVEFTSSTSQWSDGAVSGFLRLGSANESVNQFDYYEGAGFTLSGFSASRTDDRIGLAIASVRNSREYRRLMQLSGTEVNDRETNIELSYFTRLNARISAQAEIQYIINPGTNVNLNNALAFGLRLEWMLFQRTSD